MQQVITFIVDSGKLSLSMAGINCVFLMAHYQLCIRTKVKVREIQQEKFSAMLTQIFVLAQPLHIYIRPTHPRKIIQQGVSTVATFIS